MMMCVHVHYFLLGKTPYIIQVLAALDVHTSQWIVEKCFQGDLVKGRTVILVVSFEHVHS